jgi:RING finger protein 113A
VLAQTLEYCLLQTDTVRKATTVEAGGGSSDEDVVMVSYKSRRTTNREGPSDMGATSVLQIETETEKDAQAIFENALRINKVRGNLISV